MGIKKFWQDMSYRIGLKTTDKLLIGNIDTSEADYVDVGDVIKLFTTDDLVSGTETKQFTAALKAKVDNLPANTITELAAKISQAEADARHTLLLTGSDAFVHAQRGLADGFTTENHVKLDNTIDDNVGVPFLWTPHSKGLNKLGSFQPDNVLGDMSFTRHATLDYVNKKGISQTALNNIPVFDWIKGKPYCVITSLTSNIRSGDISQLIPETGALFEVYGFFSDLVSGTNKVALDHATTSSRVELAFDSSNGDIEMFVDNAGVSTVGRFSYDIDLTVKRVYQIVFKDNLVELIIDGITVFKDTTFIYSKDLNRLNLALGVSSSRLNIGKVAIHSDTEAAVNKNRFKTFAEMAAFANYNKPRN